MFDCLIDARSLSYRKASSPEGFGLLEISLARGGKAGHCGSKCPTDVVEDKSALHERREGTFDHVLFATSIAPKCSPKIHGRGVLSIHSTSGVY